MEKYSSIAIKQKMMKHGWHEGDKEGNLFVQHLVVLIIRLMQKFWAKSFAERPAIWPGAMKMEKHCI